MLTKFAAALLATSLIASSALAAPPAANGAAPAVQTPTKPAATGHGKTVKHAARHRHHVRNQVARAQSHVVRHAHHAKPANTHQAGMSKGLKRS